MTRTQLENIINLIRNETAAGGNTKTRIADTLEGIWSRFFGTDASQYTETDPLEIGFYTPAPNPADPDEFTGLRIFFDSANNVLSIFFYLRNSRRINLSEDSGVFLRDFEQENTWTFLPSNLDKIVTNKNVGQELYYVNTLNLPELNKHRLKRYKILDSAIPNSGAINFYYAGYDSLTASEKVAMAGDTFEIYFKSKNNTEVSFTCFNFDSYTPNISINTNTHYKLTIYLYSPIGASNVPLTMAKIEELIVGLEN